jgi:hypothetical protein
MTEAPKRIWAFHDGPLVGYFVGQSPGEGAYAVEYIRADLVEAAIKRALEGAANMIRDGMDDSEWYNPVRAIRALDPAQFIEEPKP